MAVIAKTSTDIPKLLLVDDSGRVYGHVHDGTTEATVTTENQLRTRSMPMKGQTTIVKIGSASGATVTFYTVTAGKTFYLCHASLSYRATGDNVACELDIDATDGVSPIIHMKSAITATYAVTDSDSEIYAPAVPIALPAGTRFYVYSSQLSLAATASMTGWEE